MSLIDTNISIKKQISSFENIVYIISTISIILGIIFILFYNKYNLSLSFTSKPCFINNRIHIYCPGCGGTRALNALLRLSLVESLLCNPIVIYCLIIFLYYYMGTSIKIITKGQLQLFHFSFYILYIFAAIVLINFILRNILAIHYHIDYLGDVAKFWPNKIH